MRVALLTCALALACAAQPSVASAASTAPVNKRVFKLLSAGPNKTSLGSIAGSRKLPAGKYRVTLKTSAGTKKLAITIQS